jgi:hypothetical protein
MPAERKAPNVFSIPCRQPPNQASISDVDIEDDCRDLAARIVAARYHLDPHIAHLICRLAGLGSSEAA